MKTISLEDVKMHMLNNALIWIVLKLWQFVTFYLIFLPYALLFIFGLILPVICYLAIPALLASFVFWLSSMIGLGNLGLFPAGVTFTLVLFWMLKYNPFGEDWVLMIERMFFFVNDQD